MLKIVSISSEVSPFSKTGGLADVARSLPKAISLLGHSISLITPLYGRVINKEKNNLKLIKKNIPLKIDAENRTEFNLWQGFLTENIPTYFIEQVKYFSKKKALYGSDKENIRFLIFDLACLKTISILDLKPDVIHCHDWQTGLIPYFIRQNYFKDLKNIKTIYTIHNLIFQFGQDWWKIAPEKKDFGKNKLPLISDQNINCINFAKRGILNADIISTVSEQYRQEIMTKNFGQDLHWILKRRKDKLFGIINGIDYLSYNPSSDKNLVHCFNCKTIEHKEKNKKELQAFFKLPVDNYIPLICTTSRVTFQKGFELILEIAEHILALNLQLIILGDGDKTYIKRLKKLAKKYPRKLAIAPTHEENQKYETKVYAGSDMFLLPSHQEPCGINQLIAMRYGCIPIVRTVGGLHDTVEKYDPQTSSGTGFKFNRFNGIELYGAIVSAIEHFKYPQNWRDLIFRAMKQSSSWNIPAKKYIKLYNKILDKN